MQEGAGQGGIFDRASAPRELELDDERRRLVREYLLGRAQDLRTQTGFFSADETRRALRAIEAQIALRNARGEHKDSA